MPDLTDNCYSFSKFYIIGDSLSPNTGHKHLGVSLNFSTCVNGESCKSRPIFLYKTKTYMLTVLLEISYVSSSPLLTTPFHLTHRSLEHE